VRNAAIHASTNTLSQKYLTFGIEIFALKTQALFFYSAD
jgi:hypothetical protein